MPDFTKRSCDPEIMDDLGYTGKLMDQTLRELEIINRFLGGNAVTISALRKIIGTRKPAELTIADLGCGRADMLRLIHRWCDAKRIKCRLTGIDANPYIINAARANLKDLPQHELIAINIFSDDFKSRNYDVVVGTLFYHHFTDETLIQFFRQLKKQTKIGFVINDIHRHPLAYYSIRILTQLFSKSSMVKYDAPLSVLRAFKKSEIKEILEKSGVSNYVIRWRWAFRWQVLVRH